MMGSTVRLGAGSGAGLSGGLVVFFNLACSEHSFTVILLAIDLINFQLYPYSYISHLS
jgi:hypothetical protein